MTTQEFFRYNGGICDVNFTGQKEKKIQYNYAKKKKKEYVN